MFGGVRILVIGDDADAREVLGTELRAQGAAVATASSGEHAVEIAKAWPPDVALVDLGAAATGGETLAKLRAIAGLGACPAVAVSTHGPAADREASLAAGFAKHLVKPTALGDIVSAIATACRPTDPIRSVLETVNRSCACQYTAMLRFGEAGRLESVWTYDRVTPSMDPFPLEVKVDESYCSLVRETGEACAIENAHTDARVSMHPKREELAAYLGVPVRRKNGVMLGTLCSFDAKPQAFDGAMREEHEVAARALAMMLP